MVYSILLGFHCFNFNSKPFTVGISKTGIFLDSILIVRFLREREKYSGETEDKVTVRMMGYYGKWCEKDRETQKDREQQREI